MFTLPQYLHITAIQGKEAIPRSSTSETATTIYADTLPKIDSDDESNLPLTQIGQPSRKKSFEDGLQEAIISADKEVPNKRLSLLNQTRNFKF